MSRRASSMTARSLVGRLSAQTNDSCSVRSQWRRLPIISPTSNCLCRHSTTSAVPSAIRPPLSASHLPSAPPYRSRVHFIPPAYQPPTASAAPFAFTLLYRYPPHYEAEDNPQYINQPLQFLLKLAQPSTAHASGLAVYEVVLSGELSVAELESVLVRNMHWLTSVQVAVKGKVVPQSAAIQTLYGSQCATQLSSTQHSTAREDTAQPASQPHPQHSSQLTHSLTRLSADCCWLTESNIALVVHPHHSPAYSVPVNGGLPLSRGILSYFSRHRIVYLSALILVITLIMQSTEERPTRHTDDSSSGSGAVDSEAQEHWKQMVKVADDKIRDTFFAKSDEPEKK